MTDETRVYNCGGLPVELTLPEGEHDKEDINYNIAVRIFDIKFMEFARENPFLFK